MVSSHPVMAPIGDLVPSCILTSTPTSTLTRTLPHALTYHILSHTLQLMSPQKTNYCTRSGYGSSDSRQKEVKRQGKKISSSNNNNDNNNDNDNDNNNNNKVDDGFDHGKGKYDNQGNYPNLNHNLILI